VASIFDLQDDEQAKAYAYARMPPHEQIALQMRQAQLGTQAGAESMLRGALGLPESQQQNRGQAGLELRELGKTVTPGTEEFYTAAAAILAKYGLTGEAAQMTEKGRAIAIGKAGQHSPTLKLQRDRDELAKRPDADTPPVKAAIAAIDRQLAQLGTRPEGPQQADPEYIKLLDKYEAAVAAGQPERAAAIKLAIDAWLAAKKRGEGGMTDDQRGRADRDERRVALLEKKDEDRQTQLNDAAVEALHGTITVLDNQVQTANRLKALPGLSLITGPRMGTKYAREAKAFVNGDAANALVVLDQVMAQSFIQALQDLKRTSSTGASGLGQLTEVEGNKIQAAKAALDPRQETEQFLRSMDVFIASMVGPRERIAAGLTARKQTPPAPPPPINDRPAAVPVVAPSAATRAAAARAPAAPAPKPKLTATRVE
jgi:hypothetical protein